MNVETLEQAIGAAPGVGDCGVVGERDDSGRDRFTALIVRKDGWNQQSFVEHCERTIERDFLPWSVVAVQKIPRGPLGTIDRMALKQLVQKNAPRPLDVAAVLSQAAELERLGRFAESFEGYRAVLRAQPDRAEVLPRLGHVLLRLGRAPDAIRVLEDARKVFPDNGNVLADYGIALALSHQFEPAVAAFQSVLARDPKNALALFNMGQALNELRRHDEARTALEEAIRLRPNSAEAHCALGEAVSVRESALDAIPHFQRALELDPKHKAATYNYGVALQELNRPEEAMEQFRKTLAIDPGYSNAERSIGIALQTLGRRTDAIAHLKKALALSPRTGRHLRDLVEGLEPADAEIYRPRIEALLTDTNAVQTEDRIHLQAALATLEERKGNFDRSFEHTALANRLARATYDYNEAAILSAFDDIERIFTPALFAAHKGRGSDSTAPIFIVGMPRSGTTLLEQILASHSQVYGAGEVDYLRKSAAALGHGPADAGAFYESIPSITAGELNGVAEAYVARLASLSPKPRIATKDLSNIYKVGLIHLMLPNAKLVHIVRDPLDTCVSRFTNVFYPGTPFAHDLGELGRYHRRYLQLMSHWRKVLPPGVMLELRYEDLVTDTEAQVRALLAHCSLPWEDACLAFHETERTVTTPTRREVRLPAYQTAVGRWQRYNAHLGPLVEALGAAAKMATAR
jgi:tetratricopeptide (TPR) repeat protein